jgi:hypothetical protein
VKKIKQECIYGRNVKTSLVKKEYETKGEKRGEPRTNKNDAVQSK